MKSRNTMNKKALLTIFSFLLAFGIFLFSGCDTSLFKPSAKVVITAVDNSSLAPTVDENDNISFPSVTFTIHLIQGTAVFFDSYDVTYTDEDGKDLGAAYKISGKITGYVKQDEDLTLTLDVYSEDAYKYILTNNKALTAYVTIYGTDANSNRVSCNTYLNLLKDEMPKMIITSIGDGLLMPYDTEDSGEVVLSYPQAQVSISLESGTKVNLNSYTVYYYYNDTEITSLRQNGQISLQIVKGSSGTLNLPIYTERVYNYAHVGADAYDTANDSSPIVAKLVISGEDTIAGISVSATGYATLTTTPQSKLQSGG